MTLAQSSFVVVGGTGNVGKHIVQELVKQGATVVVLTRTADATVPEGATAKVADYSDEASLVAALSDAEVVINAVSHAGSQIQIPLAKAAKKAGVKLFIPADFGLKTHVIPSDSLLYGKTLATKELDAIGIPYISIYTGFFSDQIFVPYLGFDTANKKLNAVGTGNTPVSFTTRPDVGKFVAYITTHIPVSELLAQAKTYHNAIGVEGDKKTWNEIKKVFEEVYGGEFELVLADEEESAKSIQGDFNKFILDILVQTSRGYNDIDKSSNALVPGFKPQTLKEALKQYY